MSARARDWPRRAHLTTRAVPADSFVRTQSLRGSMEPKRPRLVLVTGVPGCGKTGATKAIEKSLGEGWVVVHGDDLIGPTFRIYKGDWAKVRPYHPRTIGWSVGWHLAYPRNVVVEGCFRTQQEVETFLGGVREFSTNQGRIEVILLDVDLDETAKRLANDPNREPALSGADRLQGLRNWVRSMVVDRTIVTNVIDCRGKKRSEITDELLGLIRPQTGSGASGGVGR